MPDVVAPEAHENYRSYVRELRGSALDSLCKNLAWWVVTHRNSINHKTVKIGGTALAWGWALAQDNTVCRFDQIRFDRTLDEIYLSGTATHG